MQSKNWNDLRYILAIQRGRTLAAAARRLGVDNTTVTRRLRVLEESYGGPLFLRQGDGALELTQKGEMIARQASIIESHIEAIDGKIESDSDKGCAGTVRITSVPIIINRLLLHEISGLLEQHPALKIELIPDSRDFSLTRREADLALRLGRPKTGGTQVKARRIIDIDYAVYAPTGCPQKEIQSLPWITFDDTMAHIPQARWIAKACRSQAKEVSHVRVRDNESALEAVISGLGKSLLPTLIADREPRLMKTGHKADLPNLSRSLWLLGHSDQMKRGHIRAAISWIDEVFDETRQGGD